jgi:hypothetical protein
LAGRYRWVLAVGKQELELQEHKNIAASVKVTGK